MAEQLSKLVACKVHITHNLRCATYSAPEEYQVKCDCEAAPVVALIANAPATAAERDRLLASNAELVGALEKIANGNHRCPSPSFILLWAQDIARVALSNAKATAPVESADG